MAVTENHNQLETLWDAQKISFTKANSTERTSSSAQDGAVDRSVSRRIFEIPNSTLDF